MAGQRVPTVKIEDYIGIHFVVLRTLFYWPLENPSRLTRSLYTLYSALMIVFVMAYFNMCEIVNIYFAVTDLERFLSSSFLLFTNMAQVLKLITLLRNTSRIKNLLRDTTDMKLRPLSMRHYSMVKRAMSVNKTHGLLYYTLIIVTCVTWSLPLIDAGQLGRQLPLPSWYPYDEKESPQYELTFIYQIVSICVHASINVATDCTCYGFMVFVCAQLDVLNDVLKNLDKFAQGKTLLSNNRTSYDINKLLVECVARHRTILRFSRNLIKTYTFVVVPQFTFGAVIICLGMYQMTKTSFGSAKFGSCLAYLSCMLFQLFQYCWHGNEITSKSKDLCRSAYSSDWIGRPISFQRNLLIFLMRARRPIQINTGNFFKLNLDTFVAIIHCSWSYLAMLQSVVEE